MKEAMFYEKLDNDFVRCYLCAHQCKIAPLKFGLCGVRQNRKGSLFSLVYGKAIASNVDSIEKKPLYHFLPGTTSYSIATIGCNFKCGFCQNWQISQSSRKDSDFNGYELKPQEVVSNTKKYGCRSISYTYTEPTIFFEYAYDTAKLAKREGIYNNFVTNGYMRREALEAISPYLDAANVDLKSFREDFYRKICRGHLEPVLDSIKLMKKLNIWVEVTTLIVPGQNDSEEELNNIAKFIATTGKEIPWHISRFYPNYQFRNYLPTSIDILRKARQIGKSYGLRYIYLGNVLEGSDTYCYNCGKLLIKRAYLAVEENNLENNKCSFCGAIVDGIFNE
jgi:pyruvate formate lyase activating enzyme